MASETNSSFSLNLAWQNRKQEFPHPQAHTLRSDAGVIAGTSPAYMGKDPKKWDAMQLLVAAIAQAQLVQYLELATQNNLLLTEYRDSPTVEWVGQGQDQTIAKVTLEPQVWLHDTARRTQADELHQEALSKNHVAAAMNLTISVEPNLPPDQREHPQFTSRLGAPITILKPASSLPPSKVTGKPGTSAKRSTDDSFFSQVGGHPTFKKLVDTFYDGVAEDPLLRPMYPEEDLGPAKWRLQAFLEQYWGGPKTYSERRGHPRLRMRHVSFHIYAEARDRWLFHMRNAVDAIELPPLYENQLRDYLDRAAHSLLNQPE